MKKGFTLIELLVVVAIISVLAVVVVLTLNPVALFQQGRDATRVSDMSTLNKAISLYYSDAMSNPSTMFMGTSSIVYVSIPDPSATSTAGDQCQGLGLPTPLPTGYTYQCAASSTYTNVNGTGWIPINFTSYLSGKAGSVISKLPVDPVNTTSTGFYYTYTTDGIGGYEVTSIFESQKYKAQYATNVLDPDYPEVDAKGSNLNLSPLFNPTGLVGWWPLTEGSGTTAYDQSGNGNNAVWSGTAYGTNGYYSPGKVGNWAGYFNGSDPILASSKNIVLGNTFSVAAWVNASNGIGAYVRIAETNYSNAFYLGTGGSGSTYQFIVNDNFSVAGGTVTDQAWQLVVGTYDGTNASLYVNGVLIGSAAAPAPGPTTLPLYIGVSYYDAAIWDGEIDDVRVYNRALSVAEIQALYDAEK